MPPTEKTFKQLQAEWDLKLKKSGFEDIEQKDGNLKRWHRHDIFRAFSEKGAGIKREYFAAAGRFLYDHQFEKESDRKIWEMHAEGLTVRKISDKLKSKKSKSEIHRIVQRLKKDMRDKWRK